MFGGVVEISSDKPATPIDESKSNTMLMTLRTRIMRLNNSVADKRFDPIKRNSLGWLHLDNSLLEHFLLNVCQGGMNSMNFGYADHAVSNL